VGIVVGYNDAVVWLALEYAAVAVASAVAEAGVEKEMPAEIELKAASAADESDAVRVR
jgi:hypothetical protein